MRIAATRPLPELQVDPLPFSEGYIHRSKQNQAMMKSIGFKVGLLLTACAGKLAAVTGDNLVGSYNPGFESGLVYWAGSGFANASVDGTNPGAGSWSARQAADPGNAWNVLVNSGGTMPIVAGNCYVLSAMSRNNLVGGTASLGLNELNSSQVSTAYTWRTTSSSSVWHIEYLTLVPRTDTAYLRIYLWLGSSVTSGSAWWDSLHLDTFPNPFATDANASVQISVPDLVFNVSGTTLSPASLTPIAKLGQSLVGGNIAWKITRETDGVNGAPVLQGDYAITQAGNWQWTISMSQLASAGAARYFLTATTTTVDGSEVGVITKPLAVLSSGSATALSAVTSSTIDASGRLLVNGQPFQAVVYYGIASGDATDYDKIKSLGGNSIQLTGNSLGTLSTNIDLAWSHNLYSWVVLQQPPFTQSTGGQLGPTTTWDLTYLKATLNALKSKPGIIGYYLVDEPDGLGIPASQVQAAYNAIKASDCDPNHAVWVNFISNPAKTPGYTSCSDFASYDSYPYPLNSLSVINTNNAYIKNLYPGKPLISVLQGFSTLGFPSFSQLRAEIYTNVCDGMVHSAYFEWHGLPYNCLANKPEMLAYTRLLNWEMSQLQSFLFSTSAPLSVTLSNPNVRAIAKTIGSNVVLVLVNQSDQPVQNVTATVSGRTFTTHTAFFPGTSAGTLSSGQLKDSLASYGVNVYQLQ